MLDCFFSVLWHNPPHLLRVHILLLLGSKVGNPNATELQPCGIIHRCWRAYLLVVQILHLVGLRLMILTSILFSKISFFSFFFFALCGQQKPTIYIRHEPHRVHHSFERENGPVP